MKANYHTHTQRCLHAIGSDEDYVISAIKGGFDEIGFSDHTPWKYETNFVANMRMPLTQFDDYYRSISALKEKYKHKISIRIGLECEYYEQYTPWLKQFLKEKKIDYIILGNHYYQTDEKRIYFGRICSKAKEIKVYVDEAIKGMETGLYSYLAHPDLFMRPYPQFDEIARSESFRLCEAAKRLHIPLEYNLAGMHFDEECHAHGYPCKEFWQVVATVGNEAIIGVDAHDNLHLETAYYWDRAVSNLNKMGIKILDHIEMKHFSL